MCEPTTIALAVTAVAGVVAAGAAIQQGQTTKAIARNNQIMGEYAARDAERRADLDAQAVRRKGDQMAGAQRTAMSANGLDLAYGTSRELQDQVDFFSVQDQNTARYNGKLDAWSARAQGSNMRAQGDAAARAANLQAFSTVLGTAGSVSSKWDSFKNPRTSGA